MKRSVLTQAACATLISGDDQEISITGAMWALSPDMIYAPLAQQSVAPDDNGELVVILKQDIPEDVYESLKLVRVD
jgi:hypothetical protein